MTQMRDYSVKDHDKYSFFGITTAIKIQPYHDYSHVINLNAPGRPQNQCYHSRPRKVLSFKKFSLPFIA